MLDWHPIAFCGILTIGSFVPDYYRARSRQRRAVSIERNLEKDFRIREWIMARFEKEGAHLAAGTGTV